MLFFYDIISEKHVNITNLKGVALVGKLLEVFGLKKDKKLVDKDCIYYQIGTTCNECKLKSSCNSYLSKNINA